MALPLSSPGFLMLLEQQQQQRRIGYMYTTVK